MKNRFFDSISKSTFFRSIFVLMTGSVVAAAIRAVATPVLTRLYSQEAMGAYSYLISISSIFMGVVNCRYDISIVTDSEEMTLYSLFLLLYAVRTFTIEYANKLKKNSIGQ